MKVNLVTPHPDLFMQGVNEIYRAEIALLFKNIGWKVCYTTETCINDADLILILAHYREEVYSEWVRNIIKPHKNCMIGVWGKAATEARFWLLKINFNIDFVICGEPEGTLYEIAQRIYCGIYSVEGIKGVAIEKSGIFIDATPRKSFSSYDINSMPDLSYLYNRKEFPICVLSSSRGCHGNCSFCEGNIHRSFTEGPSYRAKSANRVVDEIEYVVSKYNHRIFAFADDNFIVDGIMGKERAKEIAKKILERKLKIRFTIECRSDDIDIEVFSLLRIAGLLKVFVGIESGSQSVLDRYNKETTVKQNEHAIRVLNSLGIKCEPGYIFFDPATTKKELLDTYDFFSQNVDKLYAPMQGSGNNRLYFIHGAPLLPYFWPNKTTSFYEGVAEETLPYPYLNEEASFLCERYSNVLSFTTKLPSENMLEYRLRCLKKIL